MKDKQEAGTCPACGGTDLTYGKGEPSKGCFDVPWTCESCKAKGVEVNDLEFMENRITARLSDKTIPQELVPEVLAVLDACMSALNTAPRFKVGDTDSYDIAAKLSRLIRNLEAL